VRELSNPARVRSPVPRLESVGLVVERAALFAFAGLPGEGEAGVREAISLARATRRQAPRRRREADRNTQASSARAKARAEARVPSSNPLVRPVSQNAHRRKDGTPSREHAHAEGPRSRAPREGQRVPVSRGAFHRFESARARRLLSAPARDWPPFTPRLTPPKEPTPCKREDLRLCLRPEAPGLTNQALRRGSVGCTARERFSSPPRHRRPQRP